MSRRSPNGNLSRNDDTRTVRIRLGQQWIDLASTLTGYDIATLFELIRHHDYVLHNWHHVRDMRHLFGWPPIAQMAQMSGVPEEDFRRSRAKLLARGVIGYHEREVPCGTAELYSFREDLVDPYIVK